MKNKCIVLDTNCLLQSLSKRSRYYDVWESFILGKYTLCVTTEILEEYEEIISSHMSSVAAKLAINDIKGKKCSPCRCAIQVSSH